VSFEQLSIVLGPSFVISFQEGGQDIFQPIRKRLVNSKGRIRKMDAGYLAYALMDTAVDHYFVALDVVGEETESLEKELQEAPTQETLERIHGIKRKILFMRKSIWPLREFTGRLERLENHYIGSETHLFLRDLYDHVIQATENLEVLWETVSGLLQIYLSVVSNRMNEVMKVLTLIATLFIPLTFIAGVYGINFKYMPELEWRWGYPLIWLVMSLVAFSLILFFKKKKWL
jgi:magnesium transporter